MNPKKCCLCDKPFVKPDFGCNPYPILDEGRCCSWCDTVLVSQVRILRSNTNRQLSQIGHRMSLAIRSGIEEYRWQQKIMEEFQKKVEA